MAIENASTRRRMQDELHALSRITANCRDDMHSPDGVRVVEITEGALDNACGAGSGTYERCILLENDYTGEKLWVNLASLIALARQAKLVPGKTVV